ncbi:MAG: hypothetical protein KGL39_42425 [Patescibacteria group bacterium]|nr:hypothetical protein [Patescibacteria group bacterium]
MDAHHATVVVFAKHFEVAFAFYPVLEGLRVKVKAEVRIELAEVDAVLIRDLDERVVEFQVFRGTTYSAPPERGSLDTTASPVEKPVVRVILSRLMVGIELDDVDGSLLLMLSYHVSPSGGVAC